MSNIPTDLIHLRDLEVQAMNKREYEVSSSHGCFPLERLGKGGNRRPCQQVVPGFFVQDDLKQECIEKVRMRHYIITTCVQLIDGSFIDLC